MPKYTQPQIEERYEKLPEVLKDAMFSVEIADKIFETGKKFGLIFEKIGNLAEETGYVTLGLLHPQDFVRALEEHLGIKADQASEIAKEINHQIFFPLRAEFKKAHNIELPAPDFQRSEPLSKKPLPPSTLPPKPATSTPPPPLKTTPVEVKAPARAPLTEISLPKPPAPPLPPLTPNLRPPKPPPPPSPVPPKNEAAPVTSPPPAPKPNEGQRSFSEKDLSQAAGGILFEGKSKIPPIDLRERGKPPAAPEPPSPNTVNLRETQPSPKTTGGDVINSVPLKAGGTENKPKYLGPDPYKEPME